MVGVPSESVRGRPTPPHSQEAEESVIGGILVHPSTFNKVAEFLQSDDFYHPALRMDGSVVELETSERGGACGVWVNRDGTPVVEMQAVDANKQTKLHE